MSTFYFFQPLVPPDAVGPEREASFGWAADGVAFFSVGLFNWLRVRCGRQIPMITLFALGLTALGAAGAVALVLINPQFLVWARGSLAVVLIALVGFNVQTLRRQRALPE